MKSSDVRQKYLDFFKARGHKIVPSSSLVPENDPTTLFTTAGMQPMVPYLLGQTHPEGRRIADSQKVFRAQDIEEVGDNRHDTFFEMLGNWSLGDYFKEDQLGWFFEFLTDELNLDPHKIYVSVFIGDKKFDLPKDTESASIWKDLFNQKNITAKEIEIGSEQNGYQKGLQDGRIFYYDAHKNWWSRAGTPEKMPEGEPGGPDSEVFYDLGTPHNAKYGQNCHPNCDCGRFLEIGNSVFMQYQKTGTGFKELPQKNVDFGGGLERLTMAGNNEPDQFKLDLYTPIIEKLTDKLNISYDSHPRSSRGSMDSPFQGNDATIALRIIADHIKAATFLIKDGVLPSNKLQGYILRRLLRRAAVKIHTLKEGSMEILPSLVDPVMDIYADTGYFQTSDWNPIRQVIEEEISKFQKTLRQGLKEFNKIASSLVIPNSPNVILSASAKDLGKIAFDLYQTYGFPLEITEELFQEKGQKIDHAQFEAEFEKHRALSQTSAKGIFKGGLQDHSEDTKKHHTATHLMNQALHLVLGDHIIQRGSYVSADKFRFDFTHPSKLTPEEIKKIEDIVNQKIQEDLPVNFVDLPKDEALKSRALHAFGEKYADICRIYYVGDSLNTAWSKEFCGGPHVSHTSELGKFSITKEESAGSGIRRIYAQVN